MTVSIKKFYQATAPGKVLVVIDELVGDHVKSPPSTNIEPKTIEKGDFQKFIDEHKGKIAFSSDKFVIKLTGNPDMVDDFTTLISREITIHEEL